MAEGTGRKAGDAESVAHAPEAAEPRTAGGRPDRKPNRDSAWGPRRLIVHSVRAVVAALALAGIAFGVELTRATWDPAVTDAMLAQRADEPDGLPLGTEEVDDAGRLSVAIEDGVAEVEYEVTLPRASHLVEKALRGLDFEEGLDIRLGLPGQVSLGGRQVWFSGPFFEFTETSDEVRLTLDADVSLPADAVHILEVTPAFEFAPEVIRSITVDAPDLALHTREGPLPTDHDRSSAEWEVRAGDSLTAVLEPPASDPGRSRYDAKDLLVRIGGSVESSIGTPVTVLLTALPVLLLLGAAEWARRRGWLRRPSGGLQRAQRAVRVFLGLVVAVHLVVYLLSAWFDLTSFRSWDVNILGRQLTLYSYVSAAPFMIAGIAVLWPGHVLAAGSLRLTRRYAVAGSLGVAGLIVWWYAYLDDGVGFANPFDAEMIPLGMAGAAACLACVHVLNVLFSGGRALVSILAAAVLLVAAAFETLGERLDGPPDAIWIGILTLTSVIGLYWYARACHLSFRRRAWKEEPRWMRSVIVLAILLSSVPTTGVVGALADPFGPSPYDIAFALTDLCRMALLASLVVFASAASDQVRGATVETRVRTERSVAVVVAAAPFLLLSGPILLIPVRLLVGVPLLLWLLEVRRAQATARVVENAADRGALARNVLELTRAERLLVDAKSAYEASMGLPEEEEKAARVTAIHGRIAARKRSLGLADSEDAKSLLAAGPTEDRARRGWETGWFSLVLAVPWIVSYAVDFLRSPADETDFVILEFLGVVGSVATTWWLFGFFFGYYYAFLRGRTGLSKSFYFSVAIAAPSLALTLVAAEVYGQSTAPGVLYALQVFVQAMLLGLVVMDLRLLRFGRLGWRELVEIHRLGKVAAWGSSIVAAVGVSIVTATSTGVVSVLSEALKQFLGPDVPSVPVPSPTPSS